jgi:hypothetical protein
MRKTVRSEKLDYEAYSRTNRFPAEMEKGIRERILQNFRK